VETLLGEMEVAESPETIAAVVAEVRETEKRFGLGPFGEGVYRVVVPAEGWPRTARSHPTLEEFQRQLRRYAGTDFGVHSPRWLSRFGDATRLAERYRVGRVLLAGDAAHVHPPAAGRASTSASRTRSTSAGNWPPRSDGWAPAGLLDTTTPNGIRWRPTC
jgi:2-polyprenyl-6-methoxyphenol hydroxylase-like FAD-dependent oxidoreductase